VVDGFPPEDDHYEAEIRWRKDFLRQINDKQ
jgi:adenosine/AMP kinase